ncbi:hypothetical protein SCUCBS95973_007612 [Sporothrix curviconia]|uniref:Major facilitator superfamily (MFS) profile domain-containing protein n=1 Tax=Sporothrix curviconia TaxID=1260050 RepID=A0ABP0CG10_9PEZI
MPFEMEGRPEPAAMRAADISGVEPEENKTADITAAPAADTDAVSLRKGVMAETELGDVGAQRVEIIQKIWGKHGQLLLYSVIGLAMVIYELDNTTFATYYVYALSQFNKVSSSSALAVATDLSFSLTKPIWAKFSDIFGRGEMYPVATLFVVIGYILAASANGFSAFAAGTILRAVGLTGINSINTIIIADTTTARQRGFGVNFQFFPYLILPWVAAEIISSVVSPGGIGWKWGVGIIGIIFPFAMIPIIAVTYIFARRAKKLEATMKEAAATHHANLDHASVAAVAAANPEGTAGAKAKLSLYSVASNIDLGGLLIMIISLAFVLIPLSLAALQPQGYRTPWVIALIVIGGVALLVGFPAYEQYVAAHPIFPLRYVRHRAIGLAFLLYFTDYMAASVSHGYLYNWAIIAQNLTIVQATDLSYINGVLTFFSGMAFGFVMWKTRSFKWWLLFGLVVRIIGYGVMFRIRTEHPSLGELIVVQILQGVGDGIVQTGGYIAATINVPHKETAQAVALIVTIGMLGSSIGSAISGAIYTSTFPNELRHYLGDLATPELISDIINSIDSNVPAWGTVARTGIANAYNQVTSYFFIAAMVIIAPGFIIVYFLPNQKLNDQQNLLEENGMLAAQQAEVELHPAAQSPVAESKA